MTAPAIPSQLDDDTFDDDFARIAVKLGRNAMQRALVGRRMDDVAFGDRRIDRFGESRAKLDRCQLKGPAPERVTVMVDGPYGLPRFEQRTDITQGHGAGTS